MDSLPPEQQVVAEQVLKGGIPAVRTALHLEREKAASEGRPAPNTDQLIAMAEELLPRLKAAEWRDRAEAAASWTPTGYLCATCEPWWPELMWPATTRPVPSGPSCARRSSAG